MSAEHEMAAALEGLPDSVETVHLHWDRTSKTPDLPRATCSLGVRHGRRWSEVSGHGDTPASAIEAARAKLSH